MPNFFLDPFYKNHSYRIDDFHNIIKLIGASSSSSHELMESIKLNRVLTQMESFRYIPIQFVDASSGTYTLSSILNYPEADAFFSGSENRMTAWSSFTVNKKIDLLFAVGKYVSLSASESYSNSDGNAYSQRYSVYDLQLFTENNNRLIRSIDYELKDNNLYLFGSFSEERASSYRLKATNIAINTSSVKKLLDQNFDITKFEADYTTTEFNRYLQLMCRSALKGPTISGIKTAIQSLTETSSIEVYDMYSLDPEKRAHWTGTDSTQFHFYVQLPESFASTNSKFNIIKEFLNGVKPTGSKYIFLLVFLVDELYNTYKKAQDKFIDFLQLEAISEIVRSQSAYELQLNSVVNDPLTSVLNKTAIMGTVTQVSGWTDQYYSVSQNSTTGRITEYIGL